jgi:3-phytase
MARHSRGARRIVIVGAALVSLFGIGSADPEAKSPDESVPRLTPKAVVETDPVPSGGDSADDPAIWIHPTDTAKSLVIGTDKHGGLNVYDLDGKLLQVVSDGARPNNVDVINNFALAGRTVDLAIAGIRDPNRFGVALWTVDANSRQLAELGSLPNFRVFDGSEPYGTCAYRSRRDGAQYVFVSSKNGGVEQYRLTGSADGLVHADRVRTFQVGSQVEGLVADPEHNRLYVAEEDVAIWCYGAEPDSADARRCVAKVGERGIVADIEGLAIYQAAHGKGYLIASVQGNNAFAVFERDGLNAFVAMIDPEAGSISDIGETDGIDVVNISLSPRFAKGLFVAQDGLGKNGRQNFKYYSWSDVAGQTLRIDTQHPAR